MEKSNKSSLDKSAKIAAKKAKLEAKIAAKKAKLEAKKVNNTKENKKKNINLEPIKEVKKSINDKENITENKAKNWIKGYGVSVKEEFSSRVGSSIKRVVKFIGLSIIPILYAVICSLAFWNPIPNIGKANVTFIDQEGELLLATNSPISALEGDDGKYIVYQNDSAVKAGDTDISDSSLFYSALLEKDESGQYVQRHDYINEDNSSLGEKLSDWINSDDKTNSSFAVSTNEDSGSKEDKNYAMGLNNLKNHKFGSLLPWGNDGINLFNIKKTNIKRVYKISGFELLIKLGILHANNPNAKSLEDTTYYTDPLTEEKILFTNIHYQLWDNKGHKTWKSTDSFLQVNISPSFFRTTIDLANVYSFTLQNVAKQYDASKKYNLTLIAIQVFSLYKESQQSNRLIGNQIQIWTTYARNFIFGYYMNTIYNFRDAIPMAIIKQAIGKVTIPAEMQKVIDIIKGMFSNLNKPISFEIEGNEATAIYGIGLGEFFVLIGMYVGTLVHTFVYDRAKRGGAKITHSQWYCAKWTLMVVTGFVQITLLTLALVAAGWHVLGVERIMRLYGALLLADLGFKTTVQALWFSIKDETIGKFLCIIYMILNLSSGWGTFPAFMQFSFFHNASFIAQFTYDLHLMGVVIYGSNNSYDWIYAMQQVGIILMFIVVLFTFGFFMSIFRNREMTFGTYRKRHAIEGFNALGHKEMAEDLKKFGWKKLAHDVVMEDMVEYMRINHPYERQFKRYKAKHHERPIKPNYSDDDIMSRNDDTLV